MTASRTVPFFNYPRAYLDDREDIIKILEDVGSRGAFIMQKDLHDFESALATYIGAEYAIGVGNATDGLELALMAVGLKPGDEVICCSHTMLATASAIKMVGGIPVPVEMADDGMLDAEAVDDAITSSTVGVMPTQLNGRTCAMDRIMAIAERHKLFVVEDAAQALGSRFKGQCAGTFGAAAAISFFPAKVLGSLGDGGAVTTSSNALYEKVYQLHDHGRNPDGELVSWGRNSRLDNLQAAILNHRLQTYDGIIRRRREIAAIYQQRLGAIEQLDLPPAPDADPDHFDVYQNYELQAENRDALKEYLRENGVGTLIQWGGKGVHQWAPLGFSVRLPKVERFFERCLMLPMNIFLEDDDVHYVSDKIESFYRH